MEDDSLHQNFYEDWMPLGAGLSVMDVKAPRENRARSWMALAVEIYKPLRLSPL